MLKRCVAMPLFCLFVGGFCVSLSADDQNRSYSNYPQDIKPGAWDDSSDSSDFRSNRRREIAYIDERDEDIHERANRKGDWGFKQNWRYDRKAFYQGKTQGEAYDEENPDGIGGVGMDPDVEFLQMRKYYLEQERKNQQNANAYRGNSRRPIANNQNNNHRPYTDSRQHSQGRSDYEEIAEHPSTSYRYDSNQNVDPYNIPQNSESNYYPKRK